MVIGVLTVRLAIYGATSLKDKRRVVKSLKDRVSHRFNVSIAETDAQDFRQSAVLSVAMVACASRTVEQGLQQVLNLIEQDHAASLVSYDTELL